MRQVPVAIGTALLLTSVSAFAGGWPNWADFQAYKDAKAAASQASGAGDHTTAVAKYKEAAELAGKAGLTEIQAWQLNNAAHVLIEKFKELAVYQEKLDKLSGMQAGKEKFAFQQEIAGVFDQNQKLLEDAKVILDEAKGLCSGGDAAASGSEQAAEQTTAAPMEKITSNQGFVDWVLEFTKGNVPSQGQ